MKQLNLFTTIKICVKREIENYEKLRLIVTVMTFCASLMLAMGGISVKSSFAYIQGNLPNESLTTNRLFSDKQIETSGYLYNYDGSPDYIFADFVDSTGYAIFCGRNYGTFRVYDDWRFSIS